MTTIVNPYLGKPGSMRALPASRPGMTSDPSRGETVHVLLSGGSAVSRVGSAKRAWSLPYAMQTPAAANVLLGFHEGLYGVGPWRFVDHTVTNVLPLDVSATGARSTAPLGWTVSAGSPAVDASAPIPGVDAGVLLWSSPTSGATVQPSASFLDGPVPWLPAEFCAATLYVRVPSGVATALTFGLYGYDAAGAAVSAAKLEQVTTLTTLGTAGTYVRLAVVASPGEAVFASNGAASLLPRLTVSGASAPSFLRFGAAQVEYASAPTAWQRGAGAPRVVITGTPGRSVPMWDASTANRWSDHTLTLAEC